MANKYSFSTAALFPRSAADSLRLVGSAGFAHAELMPQCFAEAKESFALKAEKCGIHVASVHYPLAMFSMLYNAGEGMTREAREFGAELVRLCAALGAEVLVVHPHDPAKDRSLAPLLEEPIRRNLQILGEDCAKAGVTLAIENSPKGPGRTPAGLLEYILGLGAGPAAGPMVDTTEACEADENPADFIRAVKPVHLHLSDHSGEAKHLPAGEGEVDWNAVRDALAGYKGYYTLEPLYRFYLDEPERKLGKALAFITGLMEG
ncbi:MAG: sugar phosphate isomerase/epimerase [Spirochaetes bacterium]|nr:sugar phosphate isomerase/epimerase [Spirochaetota bacterium]